MGYVMEQQKRAAADLHHHRQSSSLNCPRCDSANTKFCYYNNYSLSQPRHFCKACKRYWTRGGTLRNVPVGGGCRKSNSKRVRKPSSSSSASSSHLADALALPSASSQQVVSQMAASGHLLTPVFYGSVDLSGGGRYEDLVQNCGYSDMNGNSNGNPSDDAFLSPGYNNCDHSPLLAPPPPPGGQDASSQGRQLLMQRLFPFQPRGSALASGGQLMVDPQAATWNNNNHVDHHYHHQQQQQHRSDSNSVYWAGGGDGSRNVASWPPDDQLANLDGSSNI